MLKQMLFDATDQSVRQNEIVHVECKVIDFANYLQILEAIADEMEFDYVKNGEVIETWCYTVESNGEMFWRVHLDLM